MQEISNEPAVLSPVSVARRHLRPGLFPAWVWRRMPRPSRSKPPCGGTRRNRANPPGIVMYNPPGTQALTPRQFIAEFLKELIEPLLAVVLLAQTRLALGPLGLPYEGIRAFMGEVPPHLPSQLSHSAFRVFTRPRIIPCQCRSQETELSRFE